MLLMGDILEDSLMACDTRHETVLRVGFLNIRDHLEFSNNLQKFKRVFDIVISDDGSLEPIIHVLDSFGGKILSELSGRTVDLVEGYDLLD